MATDNSHDTPMSDAEDTVIPSVTATPAFILKFTEDELQVLELYDKSQELQLQISLLEAQRLYDDSASESANSNSDSDRNSTAQDALLDARAAYILRHEVVDSVLTVHPVLRAVYRATQASPVERDLLLAVEQRDTAAQAVAQLDNDRHAVLDEHATVAKETFRIQKRNAMLAERVRLEVAEAQGREAAATKAAVAGSAGGKGNNNELAQLEVDVKASRQRWRLIKGAASAIVAGSGVDWARDAALRDVVLDPE